MPEVTGWPLRPPASRASTLRQSSTCPGWRPTTAGPGSPPAGAECEGLVLEPARALAADLGRRLQRLCPRLHVEPRVGGSILRLARDARFAGVRPFRSHLELWFWEGEGPSRDCPGFFVRLEPGSLTIGAGIRTFPAGARGCFRKAVDDPVSGVRLAGLLRRLQGAGWQVGGRTLRRTPAGYTIDHERAGLLAHTGLWVQMSGELPEVVFDAGLAEMAAERLRRLRPLHEWLAGLGRGI